MPRTKEGSVGSGLRGDRSRSIGERSQSVLDRLVLVLAAAGSQVEVIVEEGEDVLRILDPRQSHLYAPCMVRRAASHIFS